MQGTSPAMLSRYRTVVAVPEENVTSAWLDVFPQLGIAGGMALVISVAIAFFLSRSISEPLRQITRASEEMARGNYDQQIDVRGSDEVAPTGDRLQRDGAGGQPFSVHPASVPRRRLP